MGRTDHVEIGGEGVSYDDVALEHHGVPFGKLDSVQQRQVQWEVWERNNPRAWQAFEEARISPAELAAEVSGLADVDRCVNHGDWGSCGWAVAGVVPRRGDHDRALTYVRRDVIQLAAYGRRAALVIVSQEVTVAEMSEVLGVTPDQALEAGSVRSGARLRIPATENSWEMFEQADASADMSDVIVGLAQRVIPLRPGLVELRNRGCVIKLDLVQWITPTDPVGPGFLLDTAMIELLAGVGGFVDVDQYVESRQDPGTDQYETVVAEARSRLDQGHDIEAVLSYLREAGLTMIASIKAMMSLESRSLAESKRLVHSSDTWADLREAHEHFHEELAGDLMRLDENDE